MIIDELMMKICNTVTIKLRVLARFSSCKTVP